MCEQRPIAIRTEGLSRSFGTLQAVKDLSLSVFEGELFALLGVNGAGKTTAIRMLTGLLRPSGGRAFVMGRSVTEELAAVKQVTGLSPQETAVAANLTVEENLCLMAGLYGADRQRAAAAAEAMIAQLGLEEVRDRRAGVLSGGWQRRLSIAMGLVSSPRVLFLDEPTLGLDILARRELWELLRALHGKTTIVLTTHYLEEAEALADRIGIMAGGTLRAVGTAAALTAQTGTARFEDAFVALATDKTSTVRGDIV